MESFFFCCSQPFLPSPRVMSVNFAPSFRIFFKSLLMSKMTVKLVPLLLLVLQSLLKCADGQQVFVPTSLYNAEASNVLLHPSQMALIQLGGIDGSSGSELSTAMMLDLDSLFAVPVALEPLPTTISGPSFAATDVKTNSIVACSAAGVNTSNPDRQCYRMVNPGPKAPWVACSSLVPSSLYPASMTIAGGYLFLLAAGVGSYGVIASDFSGSWRTSSITFAASATGVIQPLGTIRREELLMTCGDLNCFAVDVVGNSLKPATTSFPSVASGSQRSGQLSALGSVIMTTDYSTGPNDVTFLPIPTSTTYGMGMAVVSTFNAGQQACATLSALSVYFFCGTQVSAVVPMTIFSITPSVMIVPQGLPFVIQCLPSSPTFCSSIQSVVLSADPQCIQHIGTATPTTVGNSTIVVDTKGAPIGQTLFLCYSFFGCDYGGANDGSAVAGLDCISQQLKCPALTGAGCLPRLTVGSLYWELGLLHSLQVSAALTTAVPSTIRPSTAEPTTARPSTALPTTSHPTTAEPTTARPSTAVPTTLRPSTAVPTTLHPSTAVPSTATPTTAHPSTTHPTTTAEPSTTARPSESPPTTAHPSTAAPPPPTTTSDPTTAKPPTTSAPATTPAPPTPSPETPTPTTEAPSQPEQSAPAISTLTLGLAGGGSLLLIIVCCCCLVRRVRGWGTTDEAGIAQYIQLEKIGEGGQGQVLRMKRKSDGKEVAMKVIVCHGLEERRLALAEFKVLKRLQDHPNVIKLVDFFMNWEVSTSVNPSKAVSRSKKKPHGPLSDSTNSQTHLQDDLLLDEDEDGDDEEGIARKEQQEADLVFADVVRNEPKWCAIVMEYIPQGDLCHFVRRCFPRDMPVPPVLLHKILFQLVNFLSFLHFQNPPIIHRDLKPENILVDTERDRILVTDFGIAKEVVGNYATFNMIGTHFYLAPETMSKIAGGGGSTYHAGAAALSTTTAADASSGNSEQTAALRKEKEDKKFKMLSTKGDMWALGCIIYAVCMKAFVQEEGAIFMATRVREKGFHDEIRANLRGAQCPEDIINLCVRLLQYDPAERPSAGQILREGIFSLSGEGRFADYLPQQLPQTPVGRVASGTRPLSAEQMRSLDITGQPKRR